MTFKECGFKPKMYANQYPDFGFGDSLSFELRESIDDSGSKANTVWDFIHNYIVGKTTFERFTNIMTQLTSEKNQIMLDKIMAAKKTRKGSPTP